MKQLNLKIITAFLLLTSVYSCKVKLLYKPIFVNRAQLSNIFLDTAVSGITFQSFYVKDKRKTAKIDLRSFIYSQSLILRNEASAFRTMPDTFFAPSPRERYVAIKKDKKAVDVLFGNYPLRRGYIPDINSDYGYILFYPVVAPWDSRYVKYDIYYSMNNFSLPTDPDEIPNGRNYMAPPPSLRASGLELNPSPPR